MRPVVTTEKHYVQSPLFTVPINAITNVVIAHAVSVPTGPFEVREGSVISAVYCEFWMLDTSDPTIHFAICSVEKMPGNTSFQTFTNSLNLNTYANKKNIFYTFEGIMPSLGQFPLSVIRKWIKIPKSKRRMGLGDRLVINFTSDAATKSVCGFTTYKEQY